VSQIAGIPAVPQYPVEALIEELLGVGYWFNIFFQKMKNIHFWGHFQHIAHRNAKMGFS
jgi:hypothetical protein